MIRYTLIVEGIPTVTVTKADAIRALGIPRSTIDQYLSHDPAYGVGRGRVAQDMTPEVMRDLVLHRASSSFLWKDTYVGHRFGHNYKGHRAGHNYRVVFK